MTRLAITGLVASAALALAAGASADDGTSVELGAPTAHGSWTAQVLYPVMSRRAPSGSARKAGRLMHYTTYSRRPQVLMVTGVRGEVGGAGFAEQGQTGWVRVQLPRRPNGSAAWVPRDAVKLARTTLRLKVSLGRKRLEVWRDGRRIRAFRAAVGTGRTPTPVGRFAIQDPVRSSSSQRSYLGPHILTLTAHSTVLKTFMGGRGLVAIHGTNAPGSLGSAVSHGCIRVSNGAVTYLSRIVRPGTPVEIVRR